MPNVPKTLDEVYEIEKRKYVDEGANLIWFKYLPLGEHRIELAIIPPGHYDSVEELLAGFRRGLEWQDATIKAREKLKQRSKRSVELEYLYTGKVAGVPMSELVEEAEESHQPEQQRVVPPKDVDELPKVHESIKLTYDQVLKRITLSFDPKVIGTVALGKHLQYMLGLDDATEQLRIFDQPETHALYPVDLRTGFYALYIYCDLVESQILGNTLVQLLRIVPTEGNYGDIINTTFHSPHYISVLKKHFNSVQISIKDDQNQLVPFDFGKSILKLHFRKKRPIPL